MGLFDGAQRAKADRDAKQQQEASAAKKSGEERASLMAAEHALLQEFVAEMTRLRIAPASHRDTHYPDYGGTSSIVVKRKRITGWSLSSCQGCTGDRSPALSSYGRGCGVVVGTDGLLYQLTAQPEGMFSKPVPTQHPRENLEKTLTIVLSRYL